MSLLEVRNLTLRARSGKMPLWSSHATPLLDGVRLTVERRRIMGLVGRSGGGKSTLARCIAGLVQPNSGEITFEGVNIFPDVANRKNTGTAIQLMFQAGTEFLNPRLTVAASMSEAIAAGEPVTTHQQFYDRSLELLRAVGLREEMMGRLPHQLSGGQRQRIAVARVLAVRPRLLILDEPTSALDALTQGHIHALLRGVHRETGLTMLYITHDLSAATSLCDDLAVLAEGQVVECGPTHEVVLRPKHPATRELLQLAPDP